MKVSFAVACLLSSSSAIQLRQRREGPWTWDSSKTPWEKDSLPDCPADTGRTIMDDGKTHVSKYPNVGATCKTQTDSIGSSSLVQFIDTTTLAQQNQDPRAPGFQVQALEHCPDFNERFTLADGRTKGVPYPEIGFNCNPDYQLQEKSAALVQKKTDPNWGAPVGTLEHCPDFDERFTLTDGKTRAIPYPQVGYNCNASYQMLQIKDPNWGPNVNSLEHCPDFDERFTLTDGKTRAVPFPQVGFNCNQDYQLVQKQKRDPNWGPNVNSLEHCPDFDERFTLTDGKTRAVPFPEIGFNCNNNYQMAQKQFDGHDTAKIGADIAGLEHCPDFDERFTLVDGKTRAIPYPETGYNCSAEYAHLAQKKKQSLAQDIGSDIAGLEHCPDFDERFTLVDGKTRAIPYPQPHYNCNADYALHQKSVVDMHLTV